MQSSRPYLPERRATSTGRWTISLWGDDASALRDVEAMLQGLSQVSLEPRSSEDQLVARSRRAGAVVLLPGEVAASAQIGLIRRLKAEEACVVCVLDGDGADDLGAACQVLLAGADYVLSRHSANFRAALCATVEQAARAALASRAEEASLRATMARVGFAGESAESLALFRDVLALSGLTGMPVLITGETGTGKELVATALHLLDERRRCKPLVSLNCAALPETLFETELFGHTRGAFTGAERERPGLLRMAEGGILFLDEIGELSLTLQAKLLRILQTGKVRSIGADREMDIDVRILAATNRDLEQMVREGTFREDLLHRINVLSLRLRPLRERPADIAVLVRHFVRKHQSICRFPVVPEIGVDFLRGLQSYALPGNARQLENMVCRALVRWEGSAALSLKDLPREIWQNVVESSLSSREASSADQHGRGPEIETVATGYLHHHAWNLKEAMREVESLLVREAVEASRGNQSEAARLLGITPRSVYNKLHTRPQM